jgi:tripartite motif-containing protein 71
MDRRRFLQSAALLAAGAAAGCSNSSSATDPVVSRALAYAFDAKGIRYEIDTRGNQVRRVEAQGSPAWAVGNTTDTRFLNGPTSLVVDGAGVVYVADRGNGEIEKISAAGVPISTFAQDLIFAHDLALAPGESLIYVSEGHLHRIHAYDLQGRKVRTFGSFGLQGSGLNFPKGLAVSEQNELHVVDTGNAKVQVFGLDGAFRRSYGGASEASGKLRSPTDIAFTAAGEAIVADPVARRLVWFDARGTYISDSKVALADGTTASPKHVAIDPGGRLFVTVA